MLVPELHSRIAKHSRLLRHNSTVLPPTYPSYHASRSLNIVELNTLTTQLLTAIDNGISVSSTDQAFCHNNQPNSCIATLHELLLIIYDNYNSICPSGTFHIEKTCVPVKCQECIVKANELNSYTFARNQFLDHAQTCGRTFLNRLLMTYARSTAEFFKVQFDLCKEGKEFDCSKKHLPTQEKLNEYMTQAGYTCHLARPTQ